MKFNRFSLNVIIRSMLLLINALVFAFIVVETNRFFTVLFLGALLLLQVVLLILFLNATNKDLSRFLLYLYENDTSIAFDVTKIEKNFKGIHESFRRINTQIQKIKIERETKTLFLNNVVNHLKVALIAFDQKGKIQILNKTAQSLFDVEEVNSINHLLSNNKSFHDFIQNMSKSYHGVFTYQSSKGEAIPLVVRSSEFKLIDDQIRLVSFQDIKSELDENQIESWQKLMRVLAHEISNSLTPITMLGSNIKLRLTQQKDSKERIPDEIIKDVLRSSELIEQRGNRLIEFISSYKSYAKLPKPNISEVSIENLFGQIEEFFREQFKKNSIQFEMKYIPKSTLKIDKSLIEQVLINLIQNSMQALQTKENKEIQLMQEQTGNGFQIKVIDNGVGISNEIKEKIFIPFFTTKEGGSGIGLSLSKNIIHMHGGTIAIDSVPDVETKVILSLLST